jgi:hypothetical protein
MHSLIGNLMSFLVKADPCIVKTQFHLVVKNALSVLVIKNVIEKQLHDN